VHQPIDNPLANRDNIYDLFERAFVAGDCDPNEMFWALRTLLSSAGREDLAHDIAILEVRERMRSYVDQYVEDKELSDDLAVSTIELLTPNSYSYLKTLKVIGAMVKGKIPSDTPGITRDYITDTLCRMWWMVNP
jgi:hypothetical protein